MSKTKLILCDWRVKPGFRVSVGVAEVSESPDHRGQCTLREIHRVDLGDIPGVATRGKVLQTRLAAQRWIKSWYDTQGLQDQLNEETAREIAEIEDCGF